MFTHVYVHACVPSMFDVWFWCCMYIVVLSPYVHYVCTYMVMFAQLSLFTARSKTS